MAISPKKMPAHTDGQTHLFFDGVTPNRFLAISTTGCIAIQIPDNPVRVVHWYYRRKNAELITLDPVPWLMLWACRAPWNTEPCGFITRLKLTSCGLTALDVRQLHRLNHLRVAHNPIERLDCSGLPTLKTLDCSGNNLTMLDVEGCRQLQSLRVGGNPRLRDSATQFLARARGETPPYVRRHSLTATSLFDL